MSTETTSPPMIFSFSILEIVHQMQQLNGLKTGQHILYHQYCSKRLRRVRHALGLGHGKTKFLKRDFESMEVKDVRILHIILVKAERAWSYATHLKSKGPRNAAEKKHMLRRIKKAAKWSSRLVGMCQRNGDKRTILESESYHAWIQGLYLVELEKWQDALKQFSVARTIYSSLTEVVGVAHKDTYQRRVTVDIDPAIRFCDYKMNNKGKNSSDASDILNLIDDSNLDFLKGKLDTVLEEVKLKKTESLDDIVFLGKKVVISNEKTRKALLQTKTLTGETSKSKDSDELMKLYDRVLGVYADVLGQIKDDIKLKSQEGTSSETFMGNMRLLFTYVTYLSISTTVDRNLIMIQGMMKDTKNSVKPTSIARLYEIILQNLGEIEGLPGIDEDKVLLEEIAVKQEFYKSQKCFQMGRSFYEIEKWREAAALFKRAEELCSAVRQKVDKTSLKTTIGDQVKVFLENVRKERCIAKSKFVIAESKIFEEKKVVSKEPISSNLNNFVVDKYGKPILIQYPPSYEAIPCKPLFFDKAVNFVKYPDLEDKVEKKKWFGIW